MLEIEIVIKEIPNLNPNPPELDRQRFKDLIEDYFKCIMDLPVHIQMKVKE